ncbi:MAG TPA: SecY family transport protein, partial [Candidatus Sulfotelmatobacter sp.]|nr:SecY family transport protein [Candidatus Sulfotelmatobacter sp.]
MLDALINALRAPDIRRRILFVLVLLVVFRFLAHIPVPGVNPYINASIIMQLMQGVVPRLQALSREGEYGRQKINQYTRYLSVPMALIQAYGYLAILSNSSLSGGTPVISSFDLLSLLTITQIVTLTAGTVFTMWLGELITERGIGNGVSFIIFAGIVSKVPQGIEAFLGSPDFALGTVFVLFAVLAVFAVVYMQEGQRRIPVQYASRVRGRR